jgi:hypothetical protein
VGRAHERVRHPRLRALARAYSRELGDSETSREIDKTLLEHDSALVDVYEKLLPLLQPAPDERKRRIGFDLDSK